MRIVIAMSRIAKLRQSLYEAQILPRPGPRKDLNQFTIEELLVEVANRSSFWNTCAIGERFQVPHDSEIHAKNEMLNEGLTQHEVNVLLEQGNKFMKLCDDALTCYRTINRTMPQPKSQRLIP